MKKVINSALSIVLVVHLILIQGCATICQPGPDKIPINSRPDDAEVYLDGLIVGRTPMTVSVDRSAECYLEIKKDGYKTITIDKDKKLAGWFFPGNLLWLLLWPGLPVAVIVDLASSNQGKYPTEAVNVHLSKVEEAEESSVEEQLSRDETPSSQTSSDKDIERLKAEHELLKMKLEIKRLEDELSAKSEKAPSVKAPTPTPIPSHAPSITITPLKPKSTPILVEDADSYL